MEKKVQKRGQKWPKMGQKWAKNGVKNAKKRAIFPHTELSSKNHCFLIKKIS